MTIAHGHGYKESQIKQRVARIIKEFRNLLTFSEYNVIIDELDKEVNKYVIRGKYYYRGFGSQGVEEGTFNISLNADDLEPVKTSIIKKS
ncbi:MAG TPA: hypothetical protein VH796_19270 [Nitrososphaeraceae archaeon]